MRFPANHPGAVIGRTRRMVSTRARATDEEEMADWRADRDAIYQLISLTIGARLAVADG